MTEIGNGAFSCCYSLTSVIIPENCSIGEYAFSCCYSLTFVEIPENCSIGEDAFSYCYSLTSVTISDSVTKIGEHAFSHCYLLTSVEIPENCSIGEYAFSCCYSLTSVIIPTTVTEIGNDAFDFCTSLMTVIIANRTSKFDYIDYDTFPSELQYIITTGNVMNNYLKGKILNTSNSIPIDEDDIYHLFKVKCNNGAISRCLESIDNTSLRPIVVSTPPAIKPYVTNLDDDNKITIESGTTELDSSTLYEFTLLPGVESSTSKIEITAYKIHQSVVLQDPRNGYYNISSAFDYQSPNIILNVSSFNIPPYSSGTSYKATIITNNTPTEISGVTITSYSNKISAITITPQSFDPTINNYIIISPLPSS